MKFKEEITKLEKCVDIEITKKVDYKKREKEIIRNLRNYYV